MTNKQNLIFLAIIYLVWAVVIDSSSEHTELGQLKKGQGVLQNEFKNVLLHTSVSLSVFFSKFFEWYCMYTLQSGKNITVIVSTVNVKHPIDSTYDWTIHKMS